jgi:exoribonuclease R
MYKINIHDRNYDGWTIYDTRDFQEVDVCMIHGLVRFHPAEHSLFSNDVFNIIDKKVILEHSSIRKSAAIPGVLVLKSNKTYGRSPSRFGGGTGRLLYKVIPDDKRLPAFLIPYEMKKMEFSKVFQNLYVTFRFVSWDENENENEKQKQKHPHGLLDQVIGPVDVLDHFYEYQLYCKSLNASIQKFTKDATKALKVIAQEEVIETFLKNPENYIEDRRQKEEWNVFTIDPPKSMDFDDAFSIREIQQGKSYILSIYISNVTIWMDILHLWDSFSRRISTIYLPDRKRPMLPTMLSEGLCSLQEKTTRFAFYMDITIQVDNDTDASTITDIQFGNAAIRVSKNFCYEEPQLISNPGYQLLLEVTQILARISNPYTKIKNSHELVSHLMIFMNYQCAKEFLKFNNGLFRCNEINEINKNKIDIYNQLQSQLPDDVLRFFKIWSSSAGHYLNISTSTSRSLSHDMLEIDAYVHITSPIRRLVDLLNMIQFQQNSKRFYKPTEKAVQFYQQWTTGIELDYINTTTRSIRKVQNECNMLELYVNYPEKRDVIYEGYLFDKVERKDGLYQYLVYLPEIKMANKVTLRDNHENYEKHQFQIYLFQDEDNIKKKVRVHKKIE